ncbi:MAG: DUF6491 family protein [Spongiibacteraceae bacterium]
MNRHGGYNQIRNAAAVALTVFVSAGATAANEEKATDCLQIVQIKNTRIIDDQNIVFETRGRQFYNNHLPRKCPGLKSSDKFRYKTSQSVLCNVDIITVLVGSGSSMMDGATCGLGSFTPTQDPDEKAKEKAKEKTS